MANENSSRKSAQLDMKRLQDVWETRKYMSQSEFSALFLSHPRISESTRNAIYKTACRGGSKLSFDNFSQFIAILVSTSSARQDYFKGLKSDVDVPDEFIESGITDDPSTSAENNSFRRILSGVTHFEDDEIALLEEYFLKICDKKSLKVTKKGFHDVIKNVLNVNLVDELFKIFNESRPYADVYDNQFINFKEFVCGLSTLFLGPESARINMIIQLWDKDHDGVLSRTDVEELLKYFNFSLSLDQIPFFDYVNISTLDFLCWMFGCDSGKKLARDLISLTDQIKTFSFGFPPSSDRQMLELVCDVRNRVTLNHVDEMYVIPASWWSKLIVSLCPRTPITISMEDYDALISPEIRYSNASSETDSLDYVILRAGLCLGRDYELVPLFLWEALCKWTHQSRVDAVVQRCCISKRFLPDGGWPADGSWGRAEDFPGDEFVELYPPLAQFLRHATDQSADSATTDQLFNIVDNSRYALWRTVNLSRSLTIRRLWSYLSSCLHIPIDRMRLWCLKADGRPRRALLVDSTATLHSLGVLSTVQFLVEVRNADLSWPEELAQFQTAGSPSMALSTRLDVVGLNETMDESTSVTFRSGALSHHSFSLSSASTPLGERAAPALAGVINMGNTCYIGAGLQSISNVSALSDRMLAMNSAREANPIKSLRMSAARQFYRKDQELATQYIAILRNLLVKNECVAPKNFKETLSRQAGVFDDRRQHDCQEFLQIFLDLLRKELTVTSQADGGGDEDLDSGSPSASVDLQSPAARSEKAWQEHLRRENSTITALFDGQLRSSLRCAKCGDVAVNFEAFSCVQLSIPVEKFLFVPVTVIRKRCVSAYKYAVRIPIESTLYEFVETFCGDFDFDVGCIAWLFLDASNKAVYDLCGTYKGVGADESMRDLLVKRIQIFAYEYPNVDATESDEFTVVHRTKSLKTTYAIRRVDGVEVDVFGLPFFVRIPKTKNKIDCVRLYDSVMENINNCHTFFNRKKADRNGNDSRKKSSLYTSINRALDASEDLRSGYPFQLTVTEQSGVWCNRCHWTRYCRGCAVNETADVDLRDRLIDAANSLLVVDWKPEALYLKYDYTDEIVVVIDESYTRCLEAQKKPLSLDDCFREFIKPEIIEDSSCDNCEAKTERQKSLQFCRFPPVLIVHLKRFAYMPDVGHHVKCDKPVTFPLNDFHPYAYMSEECEEKGSGTYRCISIVNHHGEMNCGHYTTYIRRSEQWYFFNDSFSKAITEEAIDFTDAYLLFYEKF